MSFTPGPWYAVRDDDRCDVWDHDEPPATAVAHDIFNDADAHLIAAAPELYEALNPDACLVCGEEHPETVLEFRDGKPYRTSWLHNGHAFRRRSGWPEEWADLARAALAKARGEL